MPFNWFSITRLGEAGLLLPLACALLIGMALLRAYPLLRQFSLRLLLAIIITLVSKIAFFSLGIGIPALDFMGFSGHTLLATAILPVLFSWLFVSKEGHFSKLGLLLGIAIALLVGWSRLEVNAHSSSEVITGWLLGYMVIHPFWTAHLPNAPKLNRLIPITLTLLMLLMWSHPQAALHIPTYTREQNIAKWLIGHNEIYTRQDLHQKEGSKQP